MGLLDPDEGVLLLMIFLPGVSLIFDAWRWAEEERRREEAGEGQVWDLEEQRERDRDEEEAIRQRALLPPEQRRELGSPPPWLRWMPVWMYKKLASAIGHHELQPLRARQLEEALHLGRRLLPRLARAAVVGKGVEQARDPAGVGRLWMRGRRGGMGGMRRIESSCEGSSHLARGLEQLPLALLLR